MTSVVDDTAGVSALSAGASKQLGDSLGDPVWLATLRADAAARADSLPLPDPRRERPWKYYDISTLAPGDYRPAAGKPWGGSEDEILDRFGLAGNTGAILAEYNGTPAVSRNVDGVELASFASPGAAADVLKGLEGKLGQAIPPANKLTSLHYAFLHGGVAVAVAPNAEVAEPVRISRWYDDAQQLATPHTIITTGANSTVTIIEDLRSSDDDILVLPVVEVFPGPGSQVRYTTLHRWGNATRVFAEQRAVTERDSQLTTLSVVTGGRVVKSHLVASLEGRGSSSDVLGLGLGAGDEYADFYTVQDHIAPDTRSDLLIKSALEERSEAVYYGLTRVGLGARNADANQENRNLLLSKQAKANSDPVLEILTYDVIRVSHGATAGPVDEEQLYYLESRGLDREAAEDLLVRAFLGQVLDRVPDETLRAELEAVVEAKLQGAAR